MASLSERVKMFNYWLSKTYGINTKLSLFLEEGGLSEDEIQQIKSTYLEQFLDDVSFLLNNLTTGKNGTRLNPIMLRYFGLSTGQTETLEEIGKSLNLSRERIRQLIKKRLVFYRKYKGQLQQSLIFMARQLLEQAKNTISIDERSTVPPSHPLLEQPEDTTLPINEPTLDESIDMQSLEQFAYYHIGRAAQWVWLGLSPENRTEGRFREQLDMILQKALVQCEISEHRFVSPFERPANMQRPYTSSSISNSNSKSSGSKVPAYVLKQRETYPNAYEKWNRADEEMLEKMFNSGATIDAIAAHFSRKPSAIRSRLKKLGLLDET